MKKICVFSLIIALLFVGAVFAQDDSAEKSEEYIFQDGKLIRLEKTVTDRTEVAPAPPAPFDSVDPNVLPPLINDRSKTYSIRSTGDPTLVAAFPIFTDGYTVYESTLRYEDGEWKIDTKESFENTPFITRLAFSVILFWGPWLFFIWLSRQHRLWEHSIVRSVVMYAVMAISILLLVFWTALGFPWQWSFIASVIFAVIVAFLAMTGAEGTWLGTLVCSLLIFLFSSGARNGSTSSLVAYLVFVLVTTGFMFVVRPVWLIRRPHA